MDGAREVFTKVIDEMPFDTALWCNFATTYLHEKKYEEALPYCEKALKLDPAFKGSYLSAGMCFSGLGLQEDALQLYNQALWVIPDDYDIWYNKAYTLMEVRRIPEAIAGFDHVLRVHPHDARSFINRRDLLKTCTFKGQCTLYSCEEGKMIPQIGYIYAYEETCFVTLAIDEVNKQDLDEYDPDLVEYYDRNDDREYGVTKKSDPRYRTRGLVHFTPEGVMAHGQ